jgi:hypothetical protein
VVLFGYALGSPRGFKKGGWYHMTIVVRVLLFREFALRMGSSFSRSGTQSALPLICALFAALLASSPVFSSSGFAQSQAPAAPTVKKPAPCASAEHRAFDFWIGTWDVTPAGKDAATAINSISAQHGGCVIREEYETQGGYTGMSMSFYDASGKIWHQTWMGADGTALFIAGGLNARGEMVLSNANWPGYVAGSPINRVTWTPTRNGGIIESVRQHWQSSNDGGERWSTIFDGTYIKRVKSD